MKLLKSHFWYSKSQRNGILFLILIIILFQCFVFFGVFSSNKLIEIDQPKLIAFQKQLDSLKVLELESRKPKVYPFNPNYISDYKAEQLRMSLEEIVRLLAFRDTNNFVNSKNEFQEITKISDSLLGVISPFFKFPDWVLKRNLSSKTSLQGNKQYFQKKIFTKKVSKAITTRDINKANAEDLQTINGIGPAFSDRIIKYRSKLQGFSFANQLYEVWKLEKEVADKVLSTFKIMDKPVIEKLNVNTVEFKQLLKNPYIEYDLCVKIFNYRDEVAELQNISELKKIKGFPLDKYDRIVLYLLAK